MDSPAHLAGTPRAAYQRCGYEFAHLAVTRADVERLIDEVLANHRVSPQILVLGLVPHR